MGWFAEFFPDNPRNPVALAQNTFRQEADSSSETWVAASCMAHGSKESFSRIRIPFIRVLFYGAMTIPQFWPTRSPQASIFDSASLTDSCNPQKGSHSSPLFVGFYFSIS